MVGTYGVWEWVLQRWIKGVVGFRYVVWDGGGHRGQGWWTLGLRFVGSRGSRDLRSSWDLRSTQV